MSTFRFWIFSCPVAQVAFAALAFAATGEPVAAFLAALGFGVSVILVACIMPYPNGIVMGLIGVAGSAGAFSTFPLAVDLGSTIMSASIEVGCVMTAAAALSGALAVALSKPARAP